MMRTHNHPNVIGSIEAGDDLLKTFQTCNKLLEEIQKSLEDYLETKRSAFPRFYFLSNDELLAILSQTRDPTAVQPHVSKVCLGGLLLCAGGRCGLVRVQRLCVRMTRGVRSVSCVHFALCAYRDRSLASTLLLCVNLCFAPCHLFLCPALQCFDSIASLQFGDDEDTKRDIVGMNSSEGERVPSTSSVSTVGNVENWLGDVEAMMRGTLCDVAKEALACYPAPEHAIDRGDWFFEFPAQVCGWLWSVVVCCGVCVLCVLPIPSSANTCATL